MNPQQTPVTASQAEDDPVDTPTPQPEWTGTEPLTMLLIGVDRREDEAARSDTLILINIDPQTESAAILSIPRVSFPRSWGRRSSENNHKKVLHKSVLPCWILRKPQWFPSLFPVALGASTHVSVKDMWHIL